MNFFNFYKFFNFKYLIFMIPKLGVSLGFTGLGCVFYYSYIENIKIQKNQIINDLKKNKEYLYKH